MNLIRKNEQLTGNQIFNLSNPALEARSVKGMIVIIGRYRCQAGVQATLFGMVAGRGKLQHLMRY